MYKNLKMIGSTFYYFTEDKYIFKVYTQTIELVGSRLDLKTSIHKWSIASRKLNESKNTSQIINALENLDKAKESLLSNMFVYPPYPNQVKINYPILIMEAYESRHFISKTITDNSLKSCFLSDARYYPADLNTKLLMPIMTITISYNDFVKGSVRISHTINNTDLIKL